MKENKEIKISLGTLVCVFIIIVLIISLGLVYYLGFIKNEKPSSIPENNNEIIGTNQTPVTLSVGSYIGNPMDDDIDFSETMVGSVDEFEVRLKEDNTCDIYEGVGTTHLGTYKIEGNKLICHTVICRAEEGPLSYFEENAIFEYEIINKTTIKLVKISGLDLDIYARKIGRTFTLSEAELDNMYNETTTENEVKIEGTYYSVGNDNSEGLVYTFEGNTVTFNAIYITKGTYDIVGNKIKITYSEAYEDGKAIEFPNGQYEELTIVDENTLTSQTTINGVVYNGTYVKDSN